MLTTLPPQQPRPQIKNRAVVNEDVSQSAVDMQAELLRLRQEVAVLRQAVSSAGGGDSGCGGGGSAEDLGQALALNGQLEERVAHLQEQLGRMRQ